MTTTHLAAEQALRSIIAVYKGAFGREPSPSFVDAQRQRIERGDTSEQLISELFESGTYRQHIQQYAKTADRPIYVFENLTRDDTKLSALFEKTATYWRSAADDEKEMYYSVVSNPNYRDAFGEADKEAFFASGRPLADRLLDAMTQQGLAAERLSVMDYGAGVGRVAAHVAPHFEHLTAVDFSPGHLAALVENVRQRASLDASRLGVVALSSLRDLEKLPSVDVIYSYIVLQHNTPPVIAYVLRRLLQSLKPRGLALLQLPLHIPFYRFEAEAYLADPRAGTRMEMHILPKENVKRIAAECGCRVIDTTGGGAKRVYSELFLIVRQ